MIDDQVAGLVICLIVAATGAIVLAIGAGRRRRWRDPERFFTWEQKQRLLHGAGHRCEHKRLLWWRCTATTHLEADHVVPWSRGGPTQLWNGAVLCRRHNRLKSNVAPTALYRWLLVRRRRTSQRSHGAPR